MTLCDNPTVVIVTILALFGARGHAGGIQRPQRRQVSPFALRQPPVTFFPSGLPTEVAADTVQSFQSRVETPDSLGEIFQGFSAASNVSFSLRRTNITLVSGATLTDSFTTVRQSTGDMTIFHPSITIGSIFDVDVIATDLGTGTEILVVSWSYLVVVDNGTLTRTNVPFTVALNGIDLTEAQLPTRFAVGSAQRFLAPASDRSVPLSTTNARFFNNLNGRVTYQFDLVVQTGQTQPPPEGDVLINTNTGSITIQPTATYSVTYELTAFDSQRTVVSLLRWTFETLLADTATQTNGPRNEPCLHGTPIDAVPFDNNFTCNCTGSGFSGLNCEVATPLPQLQVVNAGQFVPVGEDPQQFTFYNRTKWAWGRTYNVAPINITRAFFVADTGAIIDVLITFRLLWNRNAPPAGFLVDSSTGAMLIRVPRRNISSVGRLMSDALGTTSAVTQLITYTLLPADVDNPEARGPNGRDCQNGGTKTDVDDGEREFDLSYTCACVGKFTGDNCDVEISTANGNESDSTELTVVYAVSGGLVGALLVGLVVTRYRLMMAKRRPADLSAVQDEILTTLGMPLNVAHDEMGFSLQLGPKLPRAAETADHGALTSTVESSLLGALRNLNGIPNKLSALLKQKSTVVVADVTDGTALLRIKRPPKVHGLKLDSEESFVAALQRCASAHKISVNKQFFVHAVSIAVPKRLPREIHRHSVLRLEILVCSTLDYKVLRRLLTLCVSCCRVTGTMLRSSRQVSKSVIPTLQLLRPLSHSRYQSGALELTCFGRRH